MAQSKLQVYLYDAAPVSVQTVFVAESKKSEKWFPIWEGDQIFDFEGNFLHLFIQAISDRIADRAAGLEKLRLEG